jgi:putative oxidoreductase
MQHYAQLLTAWAPVIGRVLLGLIFIHSAFYKIPGTAIFTMQIETSVAAGIPLPTVAVFLAFVLELIGGIALIIGWQVRLVSLLLIGFVILIAAFFVRSFVDQIQLTIFFSCLQLIAALLYVYAFGPGKYSIHGKESTMVEMHPHYET